MRIKRSVVVCLATLTLAAPALAMPSEAEERAGASPGAPGAGDPYFPEDGNGGYDVRHYDLDLRYRPASDRLSGTGHDLCDRPPRSCRGSTSTWSV